MRNKVFQDWVSWWFQVCSSLWVTFRMTDGCARWKKKGSVVLSCCPQVNIALPCYSLRTSQPRCQGSGLLPVPIECFHSRDQHLCKFIGTKGNVCIRKEFNSQRICSGHQHGRRFIVLGHQYGRGDVMWKYSIEREGRVGENPGNEVGDE